MKKEDIKNDEDIINYITSIEELAQFGKYDTLKLVTRLGIVENDISALARKGFVNIDHIVVPSMTGTRVAIFYEFNDRWRNLKKFGNYADFIKWEDEERNQEIKKIKTEREFIESQNDFQKINNNFISRQSQLISSQLRTNESTIVTNDNIKLTNLNIQQTNTNIGDSNSSLKSIFRWTLIVAGIGLIISCLNTYETFHKDTLTEQLKVSDSLLQVKRSENALLKKSLDSATRKP